ncbi:MAG: VanZ family protein [Planctomycetes bacterium]|nr:VanZ family protein [Planctomycetota bacterium]MCB9918286.1 VanZ family protein [Planctomycetota bacterium]
MQTACGPSKRPENVPGDKGRTARRVSRILLAFVVAAGAVLAFSPRGVISPDLGTGIGDKAAHAVFAALIGVLIAFAMNCPNTLLVLLGIVVMAAGVELVQPWFGRGCDFDDGLMTVIGACAGYAFARLVAHGIRRAP